MPFQFNFPNPEEDDDEKRSQGAGMDSISQKGIHWLGVFYYESFNLLKSQISRTLAFIERQCSVLCLFKNLQNFSNIFKTHFS